ncbi:MAG: alpha/beta hydrolase [Coriobacteriia bacterium]|nr:alpha/beta hydrolase [Coriobacteriia bacterium]
MAQLPRSEYHPFRSAETRERYLARYDALEAASPISWTTMVLDTEHGKTLIRTTGPEHGRPLVMLNGVWAHSLQWPSQLIEALSRGHRVYCPDSIYDFGRSVCARPPDGTGDYLAWIDESLDALGLTRDVSIFGVSRGAWLAAEYARHAPERLAKTVWMSPALVVCGASWRNATNAPRSLAAFIRPSQRTVGAMLRWLMPDMAALRPQEFEQYVSDMVLGLECFTNATNVMRGPRVFTPAELGRIRTPVLYLAGEREKLSSPKAAAARLSKVAPQIQVAVLPDAGHDLADLHPDAVADQVIRFLDG